MTDSRDVQHAIGRRRLRRLVQVVIVLAVLVSSVAPMPSPSAVAQTPGLELLGTLDFPADQPQLGTAKSIIGMDQSTQRLYVAVTAGGSTAIRIAEFDLTADVPAFVRMGEPGATTANVLTPSTAVIDAGRRRAIVLSNTGARPLIDIIDLQTLARTATWEVATVVPGFAPKGITYDEGSDLLYLVGELEGSSAASDVVVLGGTSQGGAMVAAIEAASGALVWATQPKGCDIPLSSANTGATIRLSASRPMLYIFCRPGTTAAQSTGQGGLVRLDITGSEDMTGLVTFPTEFFPVSGNYSSDIHKKGVGGFDPVSERFFAHSLSSQTHGAWVFDGRRSSWIGFVAAPDDNNNKYGIDATTGKHYMAGGSSQTGSPTGYINVTDGRATPVPQGHLLDDYTVDHRPTGTETILIPNGDIAVDPPTQRLFMPYIVPATEEPGDVLTGFAVLRDTLPTITPRPPLDLDLLTHDLGDGDANVEFSANTSGFGAQYVVVGGWENVYTRATVPVFGIAIAPLAPNPANIRYGNRGATMALVEQVGIASSGSSATAIATRPDDNTPADAENKQNDATSSVGGLPVTDDEEEAEEFSYATCLDGIGEAVSTEEGAREESAHAVVHCDLEKLETTAHARFSGGSGGGGVVVSNSSFDGRTFRDTARGVVTETTAIAEGIFFGEVNVGGWGIDRVTSTATTWANGLDGSAHVRWERTVQGARTYDADGTASAPRSCTTIVESGKEVVQEGDCRSLQQSLNELMPNRFEVKFPLPEAVATPGGAFASVQETESDYLSGNATNNDQLRVVPGMEVTVFADGTQRGRLWVQLAAVRADATFIRTPVFTFDLPESPSGTAGTGDAGPGDAAIGPTTGSAAPPTTTSAPVGGSTVPLPDVVEEPTGMILASHEERLVAAFGWLPVLRSFRDALLIGLLYLLFGLPLVEVIRRRRLLETLTDELTGTS